VIASLDHDTRRDLMAFYVSGKTRPAAVARTLKADHATLVYHTQILAKVGAVEAQGWDGPNQMFSASELGQMAFVKLTSDPE
jgi:hypothetical protein